MNYTKKWYKPESTLLKVIVTILLIVFIRLCSNIPVPYINKEYLSILFADKSAFSLINAFSGGAFTKMTFMALSVTPYITASIIMQLLTIIFPKLIDIQKGSDSDRKRWERIQIVVGIALSILQAVTMAIKYGKDGLISNYGFLSVFIVSLCWSVGAIIIILIGTYITKCCIGNGISIILTCNIIAELPSDVIAFYNAYITNQTIKTIVIACSIGVIIVLGLTIATVIFNNAQKEIPVIYSKSYSTSKTATKNNSIIPIKLNIPGVMPVIFASTIYSLPLMFLSNSQNKVAQAIIHFCSSTYWFNTQYWYRSIGFIIYGALVIFFAYFYTAMVFNTNEISQNLKRSGACIPGIRPGQSTSNYLNSQSKYMTLIGAIYLFILTQIPMIVSCFSRIKSFSFGGTSIIIIVSVIIETTLLIKSKFLYSSYSRRPKTGVNTKTSTLF